MPAGRTPEESEPAVVLPIARNPARGDVPPRPAATRLTGLDRLLRLLRCDRRRGWCSHLFGTALAYPDGRHDDNGDGRSDHPDEVGVKQRLDERQLPAGPDHLSLWDILRTFRANPAKGWDTDLEVGNPSYGVLRFIDRAVDIHDLGDDVRLMLRQCIDPLATDEPFETLPKI